MSKRALNSDNTDSVRATKRPRKAGKDHGSALALSRISRHESSTAIASGNRGLFMFEELVEDMQREIVDNYLDEVSLFSFALTSRKNFREQRKRIQSGRDFAVRLRTEIGRNGYIGLLEFIISSKWFDISMHDIFMNAVLYGQLEFLQAFTYNFNPSSGALESVAFLGRHASVQPFRAFLHRIGRSGSIPMIAFFTKCVERDLYAVLEGIVEADKVSVLEHFGFASNPLRRLNRPSPNFESLFADPSSSEVKSVFNFALNYSSIKVLKYLLDSSRIESLQKVLLKDPEFDSRFVANQLCSNSSIKNIEIFELIEEKKLVEFDLADAVRSLSKRNLPAAKFFLKKFGYNVVISKVGFDEIFGIMITAFRAVGIESWFDFGLEFISNTVSKYRHCYCDAFREACKWESVSHMKRFLDHLNSLPVDWSVQHLSKWVVNSANHSMSFDFVHWVFSNKVKLNLAYHEWTEFFGQICRRPLSELIELVSIGANNNSYEPGPYLYDFLIGGARTPAETLQCLRFLKGLGTECDNLNFSIFLYEFTGRFKYSMDISTIIEEIFLCLPKNSRFQYSAAFQAVVMARVAVEDLPRISMKLFNGSESDNQNLVNFQNLFYSHFLMEYVDFKLLEDLKPRLQCLRANNLMPIPATPISDILELADQTYLKKILNPNYPLGDFLGVLNQTGFNVDEGVWILAIDKALHGSSDILDVLKTCKVPFSNRIVLHAVNLGFQRRPRAWRWMVSNGMVKFTEDVVLALSNGLENNGDKNSFDSLNSSTSSNYSSDSNDSD